MRIIACIKAAPDDADAVRIQGGQLGRDGSVGRRHDDA